ncbi:MAG: fibronectin type III domain-containing protein [Chitinophagales bacterium]
MQKTILLVLGTFLFSLQTIIAQTACGDRYQTDVFTDFSVTQDVQYGSNIDVEGNNKILKFDFYEPTDDDLEGRPLIIWAHGGAFVSGNENSNDIVSLCEAFSLKGYVNASINYRLLSNDYIIAQLGAGTPLEEIFFDAVVKSVADMRAAIRFFRKDAATDNIYNIDPNQIYVGGASAGGFMALHTAYLTTESDFDNYTIVDGMQFVNANGGFEGDSGNDGYSSEVSGAINLCGAIGSPDFMQAGEVPVVSIHGDADTVVPYDSSSPDANGFGAIELYGSFFVHEQANLLGINNALWTLEGEEHMAHANNANFPQTVSFISDFLYPLIECESILECSTPTNQSELVIGTTTLTLAWDNVAAADSYEIAGKKQGSDWNVYPANSNLRTFNGLKPNTTYKWAVRSVCADGEMSEWSDIRTFTTLGGN